MKYKNKLQIFKNCTLSFDLQHFLGDFATGNTNVAAFWLDWLSLLAYKY